MRRKGIAGIAALTALAFAAILFLNQPPAARALETPRWGANYFPNLELTDQYGNKHHFYDDLLKGKLVAIDMIYTHCVDSCPLETARLVEVQKLLGDRVGKDIFFYSITLDPKRDTPEVLKAYADKYHVRPGWLFLTGKPADIEAIGRKLGLYSDPDPSNRDGHTASLLLGNEPAGEWTRSTATDNPHFLSVMIGDRLDSWKHISSEPKPSYAEAPALHLDQGRYLFTTHCAACHTIGHGDKIGPDLLGVTNVRDHAWLTNIIQIPDKMLSGGDPVAAALFKKYNQVQMPNLRVSAPDAAALIKFLEDETAAAQNKEPEKSSEKAPEKSASVASAPGTSER